MFLHIYFIEIKNRLFIVGLSWVSTIIVCYFYREILLIAMIKPTFYSNCYASSYFIFTDVKELFNVYISLIFFFANQTCCIGIIYNFFMFFYLGLYVVEYKKLKKTFKSILISFFLAIFVSYYFIIPMTWYFFLNFQNKTQDVNFISFFFEAKISEYLDFFYQIYFLSILSFQILGISVLILNNLFVKIKNTEVKFLRKLFYFTFVLFSTIITPPDLFSQVLMSFFLILCFEFFIFTKIINFCSKELIR